MVLYLAEEENGGKVKTGEFFEAAKKGLSLVNYYW